MSSPDRVFKPQTPARVIVGAVAIGLAVVAFIVLAVWFSGRGITEARMRGTIVSKEFKPFAQPEREITVNRRGSVTSRRSEGEYTIMVDVPQKDGPKKSYVVWIYDKPTFESLKVGDTFDVGPYFVPSEKK